ncbi:MAG: DnaJ domain-containing protein, partial [Candidatus Limnocylindrales bacterium]
MAPGNDPYRALGLEPGATPAEIKRAYRRLAKAYHPDSAGERALPRFLAIQAAYERLSVGQPGAAGTRDGSSRRGSRPAPSSPPPASRPWSADAERARATRDAFRQRSTRSGGRPGPVSGSRGPSAGAGPASGTAGPSGGAGASGSGGGRPGAGRGSGRRGRPKATIGSTSYDGTENEPFEPGWSGATWYGAASGTYWTINPKEYADPRKHGPEYLARARRNPKTGAEPGPLADDGRPPADTVDSADATAGPARRRTRPSATSEPRPGYERTGPAPAGSAEPVAEPGPRAPRPSPLRPTASVRPAAQAGPTVAGPIDVP